VGDQRGQAVVVTEADLVVGDGVVLVDDGDDPELEQAVDRAAGVQVLLADTEVERREQHLAGNDSEIGERLLVHPHEPALPHGRHRLQRLLVARAGVAVEIECGKSGGDGAGRHRDDRVAVVAQRGNLLAERGDGVVADLAAGVGDR
jgi:hypothetical protein